MPEPEPINPSDPDQSSCRMAFVGRQPIFDAQNSVLAYELLFRSGEGNANLSGQGDALTTAVMNNSLSVIGLDKLLGGKKAFVNITRGLLLSGDYSVLPKEAFVIELLENIEVDEEVIEACKKLKEDGYTLALDDLVSTEGYEPLLEMADIIKVDFIDTTAEQQMELAMVLSGHNVKLLAEKIETHQEFELAVKNGYTMFQGYFFSKPQIISAKDVPGMNHTYLQLLVEVNHPEVDFDRLGNLIKTDLSLSSKLLRYLNSAALGVPNRITSVKQALVMLGIQPVKQWATLSYMSNIGQDKPDELMVTSLVRAKFCESIACQVGLEKRQFDVFMMGMLSILDVLMGRPIKEILEPMPLADDVKATLQGEPTKLSDLFGLAISCEKVDQLHVTELSERVRLDVPTVYDVYRESLTWADVVQAA